MGCASDEWKYRWRAVEAVRDLRGGEDVWKWRKVEYDDGEVLVESRCNRVRWVH
jgi:hypothetical protein